MHVNLLFGGDLWGAVFWLTNYQDFIGRWSTSGSLDSAQTIFGIKLKILQASNAINVGTRVQSLAPKDIKVDAASASVATYLNDVNKAKGAWIYIGQHNSLGKWMTLNFKLDAVKKSAIALNDSYKRDAIPVKLTADDWKLGTIIGLVTKGQSVSVIRDTTIEGMNVWALVSQ